jgi:hypothetical protein
MSGAGLIVLVRPKIRQHDTGQTRMSVSTTRGESKQRIIM